MPVAPKARGSVANGMRLSASPPYDTVRDRIVKLQQNQKAVEKRVAVVEVLGGKPVVKLSTVIAPLGKGRTQRSERGAPP